MGRILTLAIWLSACSADIYRSDRVFAARIAIGNDLAFDESKINLEAGLAEFGKVSSVNSTSVEKAAEGVTEGAIKGTVKSLFPIPGIIH